ncbi:hypothetical protein SIAM614_01484 [Stappia aggregata IAM 12614]|uniref:Uncharacterized protein n=2 Tax=Roseibium aggregatum TaxID=187304 RepID=A0P0V7_ROSAI|nr:hypothetical protein SIAM614_01484 [Stappia aggregata IAM 12614] [Roseibium aggregatum IAM 12614]
MNNPMKLEEQIKAASDTFITMLETHFTAWKLSNPERAIAWLGLRGYEVFACADILDLSEAEVISHQSSVFAKVGVTCWPQLKNFMTDQLFFGSKHKGYCPFVWN